MLPMRAVLISCLGLAAAASMCAAAPGSDTANEFVGVYALSFHPQAGALPPGAIYVCRARIMPDTGATQPPAGSSNSAGNQSECALEVPFAWQANRPQPVATLSYEVDAVAADGHVISSVTRQGVALPVSAPGVAQHINVIF
jgi:hypothetical protein